MHNLLEYIGLSSYRESFNHYGIITFNNYFSIIQKKIERQKLEEEIIQAFEFFDKDKKGYFDIDFFKSLMLSLREKLTVEEVNDMVTEAEVLGVLDIKSLLSLYLIQNNELFFKYINISIIALL